VEFFVACTEWSKKFQHASNKNLPGHPKIRITEGSKVNFLSKRAEVFLSHPVIERKISTNKIKQIL
jgi:hypothetical protein